MRGAVSVGAGGWLLVCDGMGGARGGREASQSACDVIERCFQEQYASKCLPGEEETFLKKSLLSANRFVFQKACGIAGQFSCAIIVLIILPDPADIRFSCKFHRLLPLILIFTLSRSFRHGAAGRMRR